MVLLSMILKLFTLFPAGLLGSGGTFFMPPQDSTFADEVDIPFYFIYYVCLFFFVLTMGVMGWFMIKYRRREEGQAVDPTAPTHHTLLEVTWSAIPLVLVIIMFYVGFTGYMNMITAPANSYLIEVTAKQWAWEFKYPNGGKLNELHVPANRPVKLVMNSVDVIHAFFVPDFRVKQDIVPHKFSSVWFEVPNDDGQVSRHNLFCAEYCGTDHSGMLSMVIVHPTMEAFEATLADLLNIGKYPPAVAGALLWQRRGCQSCHTNDEKLTPLTGPSWDGMWDRALTGQTSFLTGESINIDAEYDGLVENYIVESIRSPQKRIVDGYPPTMSLTQLDDEEIGYLIAYMKWLRQNKGSAFDVYEAGGEVNGRTKAEDEAATNDPDAGE